MIRRQVLFEFSPLMWVYWRDTKSHIVRRRLKALLADAFDFVKQGGKR